MKKQLSIIISMILIITNLMAQDYFKGQIITQSNDTVFGFIQNFDFELALKHINFRKDFDSEIVQYQPKDIKFFSVDNRHYITAEVKSLACFRDNFNETSKEQIRFETEWAFLQILVDGGKKLYYNVNGFRNDHFYIEYNNEILLLEYTKYKESIDGYQYQRENKKYQGQLKYYLNDCPDLAPMIETSAYEKESLIKVFTKYYNCLSGQTYVASDAELHSKPSSKKNKGRFKFSLMPGMFMSFIQFEPSSQVYFTEPGSNVCYSPSMAVRFEYYPNKVKQNFSIQLELNNNHSYFNGDYLFFKAENQTTLFRWNYSSDRSKLNILPAYRFHFNKFSFYVNAGLSIGFNQLYGTYSSTDMMFIDNEEYRYYSENTYLNENKIELTVLGGVGLQYWKVFLELRYDYMKGVKTHGFDARFHGVHTFLGYRF
jgi:hypothetical protein